MADTGLATRGPDRHAVGARRARQVSPPRCNWRRAWRPVQRRAGHSCQRCARAALDPEADQQLTQGLDGFLERDRDRALFNLGPKPTDAG